MKIHLSLAAYPRCSPHKAMTRAMCERASEPFLGQLSLDHVQVCPQNMGVLTRECLNELMAEFPETQFRLHANARVLHARLVEDLDRFDPQSPYWQALRTASDQLKAPAYTAHAGLKANCNLADVLANTLRAEDFMGIPVGIEGHYPTPRGIYLLDTWASYKTLLKSGVKYALDLSHLHILAVQSGATLTTLTQELLNSPACIEVHVSDNDGTRDSHKWLETEPWWWPLMKYVNPAATLFSEGTQAHGYKP